jgi:hypothetical protein
VEESIRYDRLVFSLTGDQRSALRLTSGMGENETLELEPCGLVWQDHNMSLVLAGGGYRSEVADELLLNDCRISHELTIEAIIDPRDIDQPGPLPIICFGDNLENCNFALLQHEDKLILQLNTTDNNRSSRQLATALVTLPNDLSHHILVSHRSGETVCYLDGKEVLKYRLIRGTFSNWQAYPLLFGYLSDKYGAWRGRLTEVSVYNRYTDSIEARHAAARSQRAVASRRQVDRFVLEAIEQETTELITPYKDCETQLTLVISRYEIQKVVEGELDDTTIVAARWEIVDSQHQSAIGSSKAVPRRLTLERISDNPQLDQFLTTSNRTSRNHRNSVPEFFVVD